MTRRGRLVAVDWGTSSLRAALIGDGGEVLEERAFPRGILTVPAGQFPTVFGEYFGDWMTADALCLISGMAGSKQGWQEAPYCACPAGFGDIASRLAWLDWAGPGRIAIVPGLSTEQAGLPDVMRGEEVQVFGALQLLGLAEADLVRLVLPGTHSKWVTVQAGRITSFSSWMTGEFFALLRQHSILSRTLPPGDVENDAAAFDEGVKQALAGRGLLNTAFSTRTLALFNRLPAAALPSYLSGLVIGEEIKAQQLPRGESVIVMGAPTLTARYEQALAQVGVRVERVGDGATWQGLRAIAATLADH